MFNTATLALSGVRSRWRHKGTLVPRGISQAPQAVKRHHYSNAQAPHIGIKLVAAMSCHLLWGSELAGAVQDFLHLPSLLACATVSSSFLAWSTRQSILASLADLQGTEQLGIRPCSHEGLAAVVSAASQISARIKAKTMVFHEQWLRFPGMLHTALTNVHLLDLSDANDVSDKFWKAEYGLEDNGATVESSRQASLQCKLNQVPRLNPSVPGLGEAIDCITNHPWQLHFFSGRRAGDATAVVEFTIAGLSGVVVFEEFSLEIIM